MALDRIVPETDRGRADWPRLVAQAVNGQKNALATINAAIAALQVVGAVYGKTRTTSATNYAVAADDYLILCNANLGPVTVDLPAAASSAGRILAIKKTDGSANPVVIDANGTETIDGTTTKSLTAQYQSETIHCDGTTWWIVT